MLELLSLVLTASTATAAVDAPAADAAAVEVIEEPEGVEEPEGWSSAWDSRGELALESRLFSDDQNSATQDYNLGLAGRVQLGHEYGPFSERVRVFGRLDIEDEDRSTFIVEEAWAQLRVDWLRVRVGLDLLNWTATEAFHPVDVINSRNLDSDLENLEKLGEPMAELQINLPSDTSVELFFMPTHLPPKLPSPRSRQSLVPSGTMLGERVIVDREGDIVDRTLAPQAALRVRQVIGSADVSVHVLEHLDRSQPDFVLDPRANAVRPVGLTTRQIGLTYQQAIESLLVKFEAAYRTFELPAEAAVAAAGLVPLTDGLRDRDHLGLAFGLEYGIVHEDGPESTLILEGQALVGPSEATRKQLNPFQQDLLFGYRLILGDEDSSELLVTGIVDVSGEDEVLLSASYAQRLGETWAIRIGARVFVASEPGFDPITGRPRAPTGLQSLRDADAVRLTLTRYF